MKLHPLPSAWTLSGPALAQPVPALVPGCVHTDLRRAGLIDDPFYACNEAKLGWIETTDWTYRCTFATPADALAPDTRVELVCEGLDTLAELTLNGAPLGHAENMFHPHVFPVAALLRTGENELVIRFANTRERIEKEKARHFLKESNDPVGGCSNLRKMQCQFGWDWGPRLVTAGIYRPIHLRVWSRNRIEHVHVRQHHAADGSVRLACTPATAEPLGSAFSFRHTLRLGDEVVATGPGTEITVPSPRLWWPNGQGEQTLYTLQIELLHEGRVLDSWIRRVGLRTVRLVRERDAWGESFRFEINGRAIFAKGSNWIPAHSFVTEVAPATYEQLLESARSCHHNMIRVWGGGIYETDTFYDLCDEKGLLVWQDFMFACSLYPGHDDFLANVRREAAHQVRRLHHRACLALWCGNNEGEWSPELKEPARRADYDALFNTLLPEVVSAEDGATAYWPCSPHETFFEDHKKGGDTHDWAVWHGLQPAEHMLKTRHRFNSEFGMQSYPAVEVALTVVPPEDLNVFSAAMENHQKHDGGNGKIFHYIGLRYGFPKDHRSLVYLSQVNQAFCVATAVEHFRRCVPCTMGSLYWQLNDCWPVASWSSIDFGGRWKALQYASRRFYSPHLVSARADGSVHSTKGNYFHNTIRALELWTSCDAPAATEAVLSWEVHALSGGLLDQGSTPATLRPGESALVHTLDLAPWIEKVGPEQLVVRLALHDASGRELSVNTALGSVPRFMRLPAVEPALSLAPAGPRAWTLRLSADRYVHQLEINVRGLPHRLADNFFDLFPGHAAEVRLELDADVSETQLRDALHVAHYARAVM